MFYKVHWLTEEKKSQRCRQRKHLFQMLCSIFSWTTFVFIFVEILWKLLLAFSPELTTFFLSGNYHNPSSLATIPWSCLIFFLFLLLFKKASFCFCLFEPDSSPLFPASTTVCSWKTGPGDQIRMGLHIKSTAISPGHFDQALRWPQSVTINQSAHSAFKCHPPSLVGFFSQKLENISHPAFIFWHVHPTCLLSTHSEF